MTDPAPSISTRHSALTVWAGVLGPACTWGIHLQLVYTLIRHAQRTQHYGPMHWVTAACLLVCVMGVVISWRDWRSADRASLETPLTGRRRFLDLLGMSSGVFFFIVILATGIAPFYFNALWD